ncbi:DNA-entry nuclease [Pseudobutyrivibrio ruminis]|uniref:DNA-entry nuclease n=1 Tax=Pseudobutyrivibrio ruminis TaxID=46206 RepID=A0A1H7I787_9FIRM|nr:DNA/RNA non-specific endonuclease [Pseudobutyrivibrio ruminis]SEK58399.1 DNA-entry nuclease [Pseudobutyrivibrio ruminis]
MKKKKLYMLLIVSVLCIADYLYYGTSNAGNDTVQLDEDYTDNPYTVVNDNVPYFSEEDLTRTDAFETYSELDSLGRCGVAYANICQELMPTEERGEIGSVKPSGWHTVNYHEYVDGNYLYNRCHLIGYQLSGENANEKNLITGTRYLNVEGMLPFENEVAEYVEETGNHVLYRVTPVFEGDNLVASGVQMEAYSVEDQGAGVMFNVYCYNVQPGITIDYATGDSELESDSSK